MRNCEKSKIIKKQSKEQIPKSVSQRFKQSWESIQGSAHTYKVNRKPIFKNETKKNLVSLVYTPDDHEYIGKFMPNSKKHMVIQSLYFLKKLKGKEICDLVDMIKVPSGVWIIIEKGWNTLDSYWKFLNPSNIPTIVLNIAISYLCFYKANFAHRNLKPGNIVINEDLTIKFMDLQMCQMNDRMYGTKKYISPQMRKVRWNQQDAYAYGQIIKQICQERNFKDQVMECLIQNCLNPEKSKRWTWKEIYQFWNIQTTTEPKGLQTIVQKQSQNKKKIERDN